MDSLPIELLDIIASHGSNVYYGLLGYKFFADTLNYNKQLDFMILFGHSVEITTVSIKWYLNGKLHRRDGCAVEDKNCYHESCHRNSSYLGCHDVSKTRHRDNDLHSIEYADGTNYRDRDLDEWVDGTKKWYQKGLLHRDGDLPAVQYYNGDKEWYQRGLLHRDNDLPSVERSDGSKRWYQKGALHRENDLPAIMIPGIVDRWLQHDVLDRKNGPAVIWCSGMMEWSRDGVLIKREYRS